VKFFKPTIYLAIIAVSAMLLVNRASAATEFVAIVDPDNGPSTSFTSLSSWETAVQCDLTAATTLVFSHSGITGSIANGASVTGATSGATATAEHTTDSQILLTGIASGPFQSGEQVYVTQNVHYVVISDAGDGAIAVAQCRSTGGSAETLAFETYINITGWTTDADNYIKIWTDPDDPYGRHSGKWDNSKYRISGSYEWFPVISTDEAYVRIDGLQMEHSADRDQGPVGIVVDAVTTSSDVRIQPSMSSVTIDATELVPWSMPGEPGAR